MNPVRTFRGFEAVKLDRLDVDDQVGHFFRGKRLTACCALFMKTHMQISKFNTAGCLEKSSVTSLENNEKIVSRASRAQNNLKSLVVQEF